MKELARQGDKWMTVNEVARFLDISPQTVRYWVRKLYPDEVENGKATMLSEEQCTAIKRLIGTGRNDLQNVVQVKDAHTDLEIAEMTLRVIAYHKAAADEMRAKLAEAAPKLEAHAALMVSERTLSITDASKHFGLHPRLEVFPYLRSAHYLTKQDLPTQDAIDAGYLVLREAKGYDDEVRPVARVLVSQLDTWRLRVVPQVKVWLEKA